MKSFFFICHLLVLYGMAICLRKEYLFVPQKMTWTTAQNYCRQHRLDLATITNNDEYMKAAAAAGQNLAWIGLNRTAPFVNIWQWPDGDETKFTMWFNNEPNGINFGENCVVMDKYGWRDTGCGGNFFPICSRNVMLVKEKKTWEEALQHCRTQYTCLAFVKSDKQIKYYETILEMETQTASVWTGLRFLDGKWFWANGTLLGSLISQCPIQPYSCGAYNFNTSVWENRDCNEELDFLCYL